jgi:CheY-like chemotaxis protein/predicted regulator of Ras-like GTPase activity (Roadblock/LC7/MglB family)
MDNKRVLIVDDDQSIARLLKYSLEKLGTDYEIVTAVNSFDALDEVEKQAFDLVVVDYMMPGLTGIDVARAVRRISPDTQVVLMTAYGTQRLRDTTKYLGLDGYIDKPFTLEEIRDVVKHAVDLTRQEPDQDGADKHAWGRTVNKYLQKLQVNTNARCILLLDPAGHPIQVVGQTNNLEIASVGSFVAANFLAAAELARMLGSHAIFKSSYHEGDEYNIYTYDVNGKFLLAVVFEKKLKPGVIWFYTKQMASILTRLLEQQLA